MKSNISWIVIWGFAGGVISYAFTIPPGLEYYRLIAAAASMAGYALGSVVKAKYEEVIQFWIFVAVDLAVLFASFVGYHLLAEENFTGQWIVVVLGALILVAFFTLTFLMPLAAIGFAKSK